MDNLGLCGPITVKRNPRHYSSYFEGIGFVNRNTWENSNPDGDFSISSEQGARYNLQLENFRFRNQIGGLPITKFPLKP